MKYLLYMLLTLFIGAAIAVIIVTGDSQCPRKIYFEENGNIVTPQSTAPYSPRQTCGLSDCHDYENTLWEPQYKTLGYTKEQVEHLTHLKISTFKEYLHTLFNAWDSFGRGE